MHTYIHTYMNILAPQKLLAERLNVLILLGDVENSDCNDDEDHDDDDEADNLNDEHPGGQGTWL